ncbi:MAG: hypothetical protein R3C28_16770 [Pirellulaceae bacterium]
MLSFRTVSSNEFDRLELASWFFPPSAVERIAGLLHDNEISLQNLWIAEQVDEDAVPNVVDAVWTQVGAGRIASLLLPCYRSHSRGSYAEVDRLSLRTTLLNHAMNATAAHLVRLISYLEPSDASSDEWASALAQAGMAEIGTVRSMVWSGDAHVKYIDQVGKPVAFTRYTSTMQDRLIDVLQATYEDSLDFPVLNGQRETTDVLDSYLDDSETAGDYWFVVCREEVTNMGSYNDVGCLLLSVPAVRSGTSYIELLYFGIIPEERGKGLGV